MNTAFPVDQICPQLCRAFKSNDVILSAPPGAGKSTRVPLALLNHFPNKRYLLLQPRRVVVKHLSQFLASQLGENPGQTIGYRMRGETKVCEQTRLTIVTEGVLTRMLQDDPELTGIDGILFDEFHERNIHADLGLAFAIEAQQLLRDDLRILVMSATLDIQAVKTLLPDAKVLSSQGRMYPVQLSYFGDVKLDKLSESVLSAVTKALAETEQGNILVFLPSAKLIRQCGRRLSHLNCMVKPLHGALSLAKQQAAISFEAQGKHQRCIILATNIAETSLTIEGITVVIDSGRVQQAKFNRQCALTALSTKMTSQPSTIQRMGRAGRLSEGHCYRLWSETSQQRLDAEVRSVIKQVDLTSHLLDVLVWGSDFSQLKLIDYPDAAQLKHAEDTLKLLQCTDAEGKLTEAGRKAHSTGFHPRVAAMLIQCLAHSKHSNTPILAACVAACIIEHSSELTDAHITLSSEAKLASWVQLTNSPQRPTLRKALTFCERYSGRAVQLAWQQISLVDIAASFALAYPERVAFQQAPQQFKLAYGPSFSTKQLSLNSDWCVLVDGLYHSSGELIAFAVMPCSENALKQVAAQLFTITTSLQLNTKKGQLEARQLSKIGDSVYASKPVPIGNDFDWGAAWKQAMLNGELDNQNAVLPVDEAGHQWLQRVQIASALSFPGFVDVEFSNQQLLANSELWLDSALKQCRTVKQVQQLPWVKLLNNLLTWQQQQTLQAQLPERYNLATGQSPFITYEMLSSDADDNFVISARLAVKLQAVFGVTQPISLANGAITLTLDLLSPAGRPLQTTQHLGEFWLGSYQQLAKEMRGRYPKHPWPEDPANTPAMQGTKRFHGV